MCDAVPDFHSTFPFFPSMASSSQTPDGFGPPHFPLAPLVQTLKHCVICETISLHLHPYFTVILPSRFTRIPWRRSPAVRSFEARYIYTKLHGVISKRILLPLFQVSLRVICAGRMIRGSNTCRAKYLSPKCPDWLSGQTSLLFSGCRSLFSGGKAAGVWRWLFTSI